MLHREMIAVCSEIHTKHTNTLCGQNVEFVDVTPGGTYSTHWALRVKGQVLCYLSAFYSYGSDFKSSLYSGSWHTTPTFQRPLWRVSSIRDEVERGGRDNSYKRTAWRRGRKLKTWVGFRQLIDHIKTDPLQTEATSNDHVNRH